ncbi:MAG: N-formylglutamate amidohydrolase [Clostridiales bacterium]|nr:N-formylglutamate amidohydrolase [Clostridiales bacterium]
MTAPLPVLLSVPHGGLMIPREVLDDFRLDLDAVLYDGDTYARELYSLEERVEHYMDTEIARAVLDLNRAASDRPPQNPDGVTKTVDVSGKQIWREKDGLSPETVDRLIINYYQPYHKTLAMVAASGKAVVGIDCHTMLAESPGSDETQREVRPMICISNRGDGEGEPVDEPVTAPANLLRALRDALLNQFQHEDMSAEPVSLNRPFKGGYITKHHGKEGPLPWIQIEFNRALYIAPHAILAVKPDMRTEKRLADLREKFYRAIKNVV